MQTQTQRNLIMKANHMCRICHTFISHWPKNLGYVGFEFTLLKLSNDQNRDLDRTAWWWKSWSGKQAVQTHIFCLVMHLGLGPQWRQDPRGPTFKWRKHTGLIHTGRASVTPANGTCYCQWECSHCSQATPKEKHSNLQARRVAHPLWLRPQEEVRAIWAFVKAEN